MLQVVDTFGRAGQTFWEAMALSTLTCCQHAADDHKGADASYRRMLAGLARHGVLEPPLDRSDPCHVESLLALDRVDEAADTVARLARRHASFPRRWTATALPRSRALLAAASGDARAALALLDDVDLSTALPLERAWTRLAHGQVLRRTKQRGAAAVALGEARDGFTVLRAGRWEAVAAAELDRLGLRRPAPADGPDTLTASERRVAVLVAEGLTNREAAAALFISPKTVEANLARVYRKLTVRSRTELAARFAANEPTGALGGQP
jgi:DNA-binding CsgD family transcriptional regulator